MPSKSLLDTFGKHHPSGDCLHLSQVEQYNFDTQYQNVNILNSLIIIHSYLSDHERRGHILYSELPQFVHLLRYIHVHDLYTLNVVEPM